ncbi:MFS transporter [Paractinoplanes toevensis]|uniref:MFS transporter n=1 Tax=Paractinoplanes toevensis TaxID=571911 RepID=A0A919TDR1_9ACTN|nr:MFS transporter [Actinoplanes toevensis]GIM92216.1 hypothetical protein Ato02nite_040090 [Actinoplanes toevensis]
MTEAATTTGHRRLSLAAICTATGLVWLAFADLGVAIPAMAGVLTDGLGWRWLFWINLPLAVVTLVALRASTPESRDEHASRRIDWLGLATIGLAIFALLFALTDGPAAGWGDPLIAGLLAAAVILSTAWYAVERRAAEPLVKLELFKLRPYDAALTANLVMNLAFAGLSYLLVLWLQNVRGYSAVEAGLLMLPSTLGIFVFIPRGARLESRRGGRMPVLLGLVVLAAGLAVLGFLHPDASLWLMAAGLLVVGVGLGLLPPRSPTPRSVTCRPAWPARRLQDVQHGRRRARHRGAVRRDRWDRVGRQHRRDAGGRAEPVADRHGHERTGRVAVVPGRHRDAAAGPRSRGNHRGGGRLHPGDRRRPAGRRRPRARGPAHRPIRLAGKGRKP